MTSDAAHKSADNKLQSLFESWEEAGIRVCIWKSADRWQEGLEGKTDFDLLLAPHDLTEAKEILIRHGWLPVIAESWRSFDGLSDYVSLKDQGNHHIHLHTQIASGEKLIKSLRPPLTELYLNETRQAYPPFVSSELEFIIFIVRVIVKLNWIDRLGAVRRRSSSSLYRNYVKEYKPLRDAVDLPSLQKLLRHPELGALPTDVILTAYEDLTLVNWRARRELLKAIAPWRITSGLSAKWAALKRSHAKRKYGVGKHLETPAVTIAVCGADGSGKTTLTDALQKHLSRHLKVSRFYLGSNILYAERRRRFIYRIFWPPYLVIRKLFKILNLKSAQSSIEGLFTRFNESLVRQEKALRLGTAARAALEGHIVLFERYPLFTPFGDDLTPSLTQEMPDLLVMLDVSETTALDRREDDPEEDIKAKVVVFRDTATRLQAEGERVLICSENESVEERVAKIVNAMDDLLVTRAQAQQT